MTFYDWLTLAPYFGIIAYLAVGVGIVGVVIWAACRASGVSMLKKVMLAFALILAGGMALWVVHGIASLFGSVVSLLALPFDVGVVFGLYRFSNWAFGKLADAPAS